MTVKKIMYRNVKLLVIYIVTGEYMASVKFNDQHIPDSPFKVHIAPGTGDIRKLTVQSLQEQGLQVCHANKYKPATSTLLHIVLGRKEAGTMCYRLVHPH